MATQTKNRPISPHLQVYRLPLDAIMSIVHRMTGVALAIGLLMLTYWLVSAAYGPEAFATAQGFLGSWLGLLMLFGWTWCLFYHLCNGVRHLVWDTGAGLELPALRMSSLVVLAASVILTVALWVAAFAFGGSM